MRIGINVRPYRPGLMGGLADYFWHLMTELVKTDNEFILYTAPWNHDLLEKDCWECELVRTDPCAPGWVRRWIGRALLHPTLSGQISFPELRNPLDLWFCPFNALEPLEVSVPSVVTVADVQHESYPEFFSRDELDSRRRYFPTTCRNASALIAISAFTKSEIQRHFGVADSKVTVVHLGASEVFSRPSRDLPELRVRLKLPTRYVFYPANDWPHKNHRTLLTALHLLSNEGLHIPCVFSGFQTGANDRLSFLERELNTTGLHLGYVPKEDLAGLYQASTMVAFPSLFEGFGMPVVEAMAAGAPVAASNTTSVPEIGGDAVVYFDPRNPRDVANTLGRVWCDEELRRELIRRGRERARHFSWTDTAQKTLDVFRAAVQSRGIN